MGWPPPSPDGVRDRPRPWRGLGRSGRSRRSSPRCRRHPPVTSSQRHRWWPHQRELVLAEEAERAIGEAAEMPRESDGARRGTRRLGPGRRGGPPRGRGAWRWSPERPWSPRAPPCWPSRSAHGWPSESDDHRASTSRETGPTCWQRRRHEPRRRGRPSPSPCMTAASCQAKTCTSPWPNTKLPARDGRRQAAAAASRRPGSSASSTRRATPTALRAEASRLGAEAEAALRAVLARAVAGLERGSRPEPR